MVRGITSRPLSMRTFTTRDRQAANRMRSVLPSSGRGIRVEALVNKYSRYPDFPTRWPPVTTVFVAIVLGIHVCTIINEKTTISTFPLSAAAIRTVSPPRVLGIHVESLWQEATTSKFPDLAASMRTVSPFTPAFMRSPIEEEFHDFEISHPGSVHRGLSRRSCPCRTHVSSPIR